MISWKKMKSDGLVEKLQRVWVKDMLVGLAAGVCALVYARLIYPGFSSALSGAISNTDSFLSYLTGYGCSVVYCLVTAFPVCVFIARWASSVPTRARDGEWKPWMVAPVVIYDIVLFFMGILFGSWLF